MRAPAFVRTRRALALTFAAIAACAPGLARAAEPTATVVEYYSAKLNHYFVTAEPAEAAMLDAGVVVPGWERTGVEFKAWANAADAADALPVCRFFGTPGKGPNSHFYTTNPDECALVRQNPGWTFESIAFYINVPDAAARCATGTPVYRSFYPGAAVSESNHRFLVDLTMHEKMAANSILEGVVMCSPLSAGEIKADLTRLAEQATFGTNDALVIHMATLGVAGWLDEQFTAPATQYAAFKYVPAGQAQTFCPTDPDPDCFRDYYTLFGVQNEFFRNALAGGDQLRQRVAFALSQIMVTSGTEIPFAYGMARYQQIFLDGAFGNFEDLLARVTLSSVMGDYLNMVNNDKPAGEVAPNENYARELMQLFSIGVWELKADGTRLTDATGAAIATYDQDAIEGFAHVFTGWTYPLLPGISQRVHNPKNFLGDMVAVAANHDTAAKGPLLDGVTLPAAQPMQTDLAAALHNVFMHPNVGPFIGRQLIQKLVTGDPSSQYVARVAAGFADNGQGVRGDLKEVIAAVLTDPEARGPVKLDPGYGKLREPVLYMTGLSRALDAQSDGVFFGQQSGALGQPLFYPSSVFNYYPPTYVVPGTTRIGPEFAIQNSSTAINRTNFANTLTFGSIGPVATLPGAIGTVPDWSALQAVSVDANALLDKLDTLLMHGTMGAPMRAAILPAINAIPANDPLGRAKAAFYLVATSAQFQVER
ncbi:MAG: DUF1800 domain-containing protein [Aromatoleum sp.]|nr:DUF1800 domain-containing protein [Aromatoleum sp.]